MASGRSFVEMLSDRLRKEGWYDSPDYWDMKAASYEGLARSNWPNNRYNEMVHARQMAIIDELLGDVSGLRVADVGCGTGRTARHLTERGAEVTAWDFSPKTIDIARGEHPGIDFRVGDVFDPVAEDDRGAFDVVLTLGCLTLACKSPEEWNAAARNLVDRAKPGGRLLFVEPIHRSRLLRRILRMGMREWIDHAEGLGLHLERRGGICFVPSRVMLAYRDLWPRDVVRLVFGAGETILDTSPALEKLADYKYLLFRR